MNQLMKRILFSAMAMIFLLAACQPAQPAPNLEDIAIQVSTAVALTVAAQDAQTQAAQSSVPEATNTTLPTQTAEIPPSPTLILPTATPFVVVPPTVVSGGAEAVASPLSNQITPATPSAVDPLIIQSYVP